MLCRNWWILGALWLVVESASLSLRAEDWPQFRGPSGQGHATAKGLPTDWSDGKNVTWKIELPGLAWASPVIVGNRIYLANGVPSAELPEAEQKEGKVSLRATCLDAKTGNVIWDQELFEQEPGAPAEHHLDNSPASSTPLVVGDRLYVHFGNQGTAALTLDGKILWTTRELKYLPQHGNGSCPAVCDNMLIICCDGRDKRSVVALDRYDGKIRWQKERHTSASRGFSFSTPIVIEVNGKKQAICPGSGAVIAYEPQSGEEIWRMNYGEGYSVVPRPVFGNGLVYVCSGFDKPSLFAIDPTGTGDVTESHVKWTYKTNVPLTPSLLLIHEDLYLTNDSGVGTCLNALTGEKHWEHRLSGQFWASPLYADGRIYLQDKFGTAILLQPGHEYSELARFKFTDDKERLFASYAVTDSALIIRSEHHLFRVEQK